MSTIPQQRRPGRLLPVGTWTVDPVHSSVGFAVRHMVVATFRGHFDDVEGTLEIDEDGTARVSGRIRTDSVVVKDDDMAAHLTSPDFFDSERHPEIVFVGEEVRGRGDAVTLAGRITIRGVTRPIVLRGQVVGPHEDADGRERAGLELEGVVDRTEFGLTWNQPLPSGGFALADEVRIAAGLQVVRGAS